MRLKGIGWLSGLLLLLAVALPAFADAATAVTTGNATSITTQAAQLNGVVDPADADSEWLFQYGVTEGFNVAANNHYTTPVATSGGLEAVSSLISGLAPGTTYFFRIVVIPGYGGGNAVVGATAAFTTEGNGPNRHAYGRASLKGRVLKLSGKVARVVMTCTGVTTALCTGHIVLTTVGANHRSVACGTGEFIASVPHTHTVRVRPSRACLALIAASKGHRLPASLRVTFTTHQSALKESVTLFG